MNSELGKKGPARPTGKRYSSVQDLMQGENIAPELRSKVAELERQSAVTELLANLRVAAGLTQAQVAEEFGVSQSAISKLEAGRDDDLTLGDVRRYAQLTGRRFVLNCGRPPTHVEAVKVYAQRIKEHLTALAKLAQKDVELEGPIRGFFGDAFFNLLTILDECGQQMPQPREVQVKAELIDTLSAKPKASVLECVGG